MQESSIAIPGRDEIERAEAVWIKRGGPSKADLKRIEVGDLRVVIKDFSRKSLWVRLIGRLQISRECRAYRWLGPLPGLPRFFGRIDAHALAVEWIEGDSLGAVPHLERDGKAALDALRRVVAGLHEKGLAHLDLRRRTNVMLGRDNQVYIVDLASAIWLRPQGRIHRLVFHWVAKTDRAALLKWKQILTAGPYTAEEQSFLRRHRFWRSLWIFNPKRPPRS